ncbi:hypothetical protein VIGAN_04032900 [Vigna angularis var. angularis]|uniref:Uncharacterized protein n=1 Tax=Vigna angularis var. angularis TaxID=157739 RepID=A0A0S3RRK5_PHAAN|nr:hypothetical protein VIGAN_04032900 [Vigna angularis var. angularis]
MFVISACSCNNRASSSCTSTSPISGRSSRSSFMHLKAMSINTSQHSGAIFPLIFGSIFSSTDVPISSFSIGKILVPLTT